MGRKLERLPISFKPEDVFTLVPDIEPMRKEHAMIEGYRFKSSSQRLILFKTKGCKCVDCGLEGTVSI